MILVIAVIVCLLSLSQHTACVSLCEAGNGTYIMENEQSVQSVGSGAGLYLNINYPAPCSGLITSYTYCYRLDTGSFTTSFSLWSCQESKNCRKINITEEFMVTQSEPGTVKCSTHSAKTDHRITRDDVLGAQIVPDSGADFAVTDGNTDESFCFNNNDNPEQNCSVLMKSGFLFINVSIDPDSCNAPSISAKGSARDADMQPVNASATYQFGTVIRYDCEDGYEIVGSSVITCDSQSWNPAPPICNLRKCRNPGKLQNGTIQGNKYTFLSIVTFSCFEGYELNETITAIQCDASGEWNNSIPMCRPINCGNPGIPVREGNNFDFGSEVVFRCNNSFGERILRCGSNGDWNPEIPTCVKTEQSTIIIASTVSVFSIFIAILAFVLGVTIVVCYQKFRKRKNQMSQFASREDLVYNCAYESRNDSKMDFKPNTSYGMRPKSEHLYDVIPGDRFASLKSQHREAMENSYSHCTIKEE